MFGLAERLGKTLDEIMAMPSDQLTMWMAYDELVAYEREKQQRQKGKGMSPRRPRRRRR